MFDSQISLQNVIRGLVLLLLVLVVGTGWFVLVDDYTVIDALYMTVITVSTVGFKEVKDLDVSGKIFVILLIIIGMAIFIT